MTTALAVVIGVMVTPVPAHADDPPPFKVSVVGQEPTTQHVRVKIRIANNSNNRVTVWYKRLPDGSTSRHITLSPVHATGSTEDETVRLSCNATATLQFTYKSGDAEKTYNYPVTTGACAPAGPDGQPATPGSGDSGKDDNNGLDVDIHFASFFKWLGKWTAIVLGGLLVLLLLAWGAWRRFTRSR
jgi:hypothetical protein